ncbi:MAG: transporter substrate-binding domain-containing protein [Desulfopila sp.]
MRICGSVTRCIAGGVFFVLPVIAVIAVIVIVAATSAPAGAADSTPVERPTLQSAAEIDYAPFSFVDEHGRAAGFSVELMRAALDAMGRDVTFRTGPWAEVRGRLERGEIEALPLVGRTPEREALFDFTVPYMSLHGAIVVRGTETGTETGIRDLEDLRGRNVAVMKGDNAEEFLRREERGMTIHTTPTFEVALQELSAGRYDAVVVQRLVALRLIQKTGLTDLHVIDRPIEDFKQDFSFAVHEGDRRTLALLNEGLAIVMADGTYRQLHSKWFAAMQLPSDRPIIVGGDRNYPPFEFIDADGKPAGYNVDLTRAIAQKMGLDIEIRLGRWQERLQALEDGKIDMLQGLFYSNARNRTFDFTQPHTISNFVAVVRKDDGEAPSSVADLKGKRIVVEEGDILHDFAVGNGLGNDLVAVADQEEALRQLAAGRYDCALVSLVATLYLIEKHDWTHLVPGKKALLAGEYGYAASTEQKALLAKFSEGLKALETSGEYRRIHTKWLGVYQKESTTLIEALKYSIAVIIPLVLVLMLAIAWTWSLRRRVTQRTAELQQSLARFRLLAELAPVGIVISDEQENTLYANPRFTELFGYTMEDMPSVQQWWDMAYPDETFRKQTCRQWQVAVTEARRSGSEITPMEASVTCKDGTIRHIEFRMATTGSLNVVVFTDITERKNAEAEHDKLQAQLRQAQKMESVGRLAGGVAHDFNNMLSVILGNAELALAGFGSAQEQQENLQEIQKAAQRSAEITSQLLAFARRQTIDPRVLDLNATVEEMLNMLRRLIGEDIDLLWKPGSAVWPVKIDPSQLNQILVNLCVNSRDAIADVGRVVIETENVRFDEEYCADHPGFVAGEYVLLAVSDDGCGMDRATRENIFEPFYTTKDVAKGTGLGLAMIYGIVKQNQGFINVYSEPEKGTTFRIYFARHLEALENVKEHVAAEVPDGAGETVLVVEDDTAILKLTGRILGSQGYDVLLAANATEAMARVKERAGQIDLLITDVVMPEMNGRDLALRLQADYPLLKVLFMSGYTANVIAHRGVLDADVHFIQKPFAVGDLAWKVREAMGEPR